ncbi:hypothetical protein BC936DRAFT_144415 [Jimgerdemannia flammicorona]|uniref:Uncharacterized protein n=1 Tax=Jimgerdemannia flammicorona TaxID=994334 RepID=A0A433DCH4_9FUNG|nr:hypothetical protein BC936DRAFT_144415 [Jimgerdemannia flammicorona]
MGNAASSSDERGGGHHNVRPNNRASSKPPLPATHMRLPSLDVGESFHAELLDSSTEYEYVPRPLPSDKPSPLDGFVSAPTTPTKRISVDLAALANYVPPPVGPYGPRSPGLSRASTTRLSISSSSAGHDEERRVKRSSTMHAKAFSIDTKNVEGHVPSPLSPYRPVRASEESMHHKFNTNTNELPISPPPSPVEGRVKRSPTHTKVMSIDLKDLENYVPPPIGPYRSPRESGESSRRPSLNTTLFDPPVGKGRNPLTSRSSMARGDPITDPNSSRARKYSTPVSPSLSSDDTCSETPVSPTSSISTTSTSSPKEAQILMSDVDSRGQAEQSSWEPPKSPLFIAPPPPREEPPSVSGKIENIQVEDVRPLAPVDLYLQQASFAGKRSIDSKPPPLALAPDSKPPPLVLAPDSKLPPLALAPDSKPPSLTPTEPTPTIPTALTMDVFEPVPMDLYAAEDEVMDEAEQLQPTLAESTAMPDTEIISVEKATSVIATEATSLTEETILRACAFPMSSFEPAPIDSANETVPMEDVQNDSISPMHIDGLAAVKESVNVPADVENAGLLQLSSTSTDILTVEDAVPFAPIFSDDLSALEVGAEEVCQKSVSLGEEPRTMFDAHMMEVASLNVEPVLVKTNVDLTDSSSIAPQSETCTVVVSVADVEHATSVGIDVTKESETSECFAPVAVSDDFTAKVGEMTPVVPGSIDGSLTNEENVETPEEVSAVWESVGVMTIPDLFEERVASTTTESDVFISKEVFHAEGLSHVEPLSRTSVESAETTSESIATAFVSLGNRVEDDTRDVQPKLERQQALSAIIDLSTDDVSSISVPENIVENSDSMTASLPKRPMIPRVALNVDPASLVALQDMMRTKKLSKQLNNIPRALWPAFYHHLLASLDAKSRAIALLPPSSSPFDAVTLRPKKSKRKLYERNKNNLNIAFMNTTPSSASPSVTVSAISTPSLDTNPLDTNPLDTNSLDTNSLDTTPPDTNPLDTNPLDTPPPDTPPPDTPPLDFDTSASTAASTAASSPTHPQPLPQLVIDIPNHENTLPAHTSTTPTTPKSGLTLDDIGIDATKYLSLSILIPAAAAALSANAVLPSTAFGRALTKVRAQLYTKRLKEKYLGREWIRLALHLGIGEGGVTTGRTKAIADWYEWRFERLKVKVDDMEERVSRLREQRIQADLEEEAKRKEEESLGLILYGRQEPKPRICFTLGKVVPPKRD